MFKCESGTGIAKRFSLKILNLLLLFFTRLAERTAAVFLSQGVPVYLFSSITPTPFVVRALFHIDTLSVHQV